MRRGGRKHTLDEDAFRVLEGMLSRVLEQDAKDRPRTLPVNLIADKLGVTRQLVRKWLSQGRKDDSPDKLQRFVEIYDRLCTALSEQAETSLHKLAYSSDSAQQLQALKFLLPKLDELEWGDNTYALPRTGDSVGTASIPRDVFDELTAEELAEIEENQEAIEAALERTALVIRKARARIAQQAVEEDAELEH